MPSEGALRDGNTAGFGLIETLRWEPGSGFLRLDRHLARLAASAAELGFAHPGAELAERLATITGEAPLRVRIELASDGDPDVKAQPFTPLAPETIWTLGVARTRLFSGDALLRHKTTRRATYDAARAEYPRDAADEVAMLNERGELCEGTITSLFAERDDGILATPPLSCGLLAGVLRAELLEKGKAMEATLRPADLTRARRIWCGNSLRGLIPCRLA